MFGSAQRKQWEHSRFEEFVPSSVWTEESDGYCLIVDLPGFKRDQVKLHVDSSGNILARGERQVNEYKHIRFEQSYKAPENSNVEDTAARFEDEILYIVIPKKVKAKEESNHEIANVPETVEEDEEGRHNVLDKVAEGIQKEQVEDMDEFLDAGSNDNHHHSDEDSSNQEADDDNEEEEEMANYEEESQEAKMEKQKNESSIVEKLGKKLNKNKGILITAVLAFSLGVWVSQKLLSDEK